MIIQWLPNAIRGRDNQLDYIAERNARAAIEIGESIKQQVRQLLQHPEMGRLGRVKGTRELVITRAPFVIVYRIKPRARRIELIRFLHSAQQWPKK